VSTVTDPTRAGFLSRAAIVAPPGWSRWLVPPAALAVHLAIGQAYAWSVLKEGLGAGLGLSGTATALPFQLAIVMLGLSAAVAGTTVERRGPRWAMFVSTVCFAAGFLVSALGIALGQYWLVVVGYGGIGGIGLGIGYISPVSTLIKWFADRPGMATGIAIMGFGGGALIASPIESALLAAFGKTPSGLATTFAVMGIAYAIFMSMGWLLIRVPPDDWRPPGTPAPATTAAGRTEDGPAVSAATAIKLPQFWLLWVVLCFNVTAGIGILEKAAPIYQDFFRTTTTTQQLAGAATAFVSILSLANMLGRFVWSSTSDIVGRKNIYRMYLGVGALLYLLILTVGEGNKIVFLLASLLILSFYGAGFATIPAYLKDLFGTYQVGAIHGRLLTAWSAAGVLGPLIVNAVVEAQGDLEGPAKYTLSFSIMIGLLVIGFVANEFVRPVDPKYSVSDTDRATPEGTVAAERSSEGANR
jgi:MFS family permease